MISLFMLFFLNVAFMFFLWHMDINHNLERLGEKNTRGILKVRPELGYRISEYGLIITLILIDVIALFFF